MMMSFRSFLVGAVAAAGLMASAAPSVTVGDVKTGEPRSTIMVDYTLGGVEADLDYKVAFDVTANGVTRGVTNAAAKLTDGTASKVIDAAALFGSASADPKAKVRVSLIAVKPQPEPEPGLGGVQLWENGPYWAECNVGASKPEEYGYYFWWGDTVGYKRNASDTGWVSSQNGASFSFTGSNCPTYNKSDSTLLSQGYIDSMGNLVAKYDAATAHLGAPWRMPTDAEFSALINNCTTTWTTRNGVYGRLVTGKGAYASKSIFLPAAGIGLDSRLDLPGSFGLYCSSTRFSGNSNSAWSLYFFSGNFDRDNVYRSNGFPVRPLRGFANGVTRGVTNAAAKLTDGAASKVVDTAALFGAASADPKAKVRVSLIAVKPQLEPEPGLGGVQLWENGPYWAECNVGASKPEEYGYYFWWGDTVGYKRNASDTGWVSSQNGASFSFTGSNCPTDSKSDSTLLSQGYIDSTGNLVAKTGNLVAKYDAATAHLVC